MFILILLIFMTVVALYNVNYFFVLLTSLVLIVLLIITALSCNIFVTLAIGSDNSYYSELSQILPISIDINTDIQLLILPLLKPSSSIPWCNTHATLKAKNFITGLINECSKYEPELHSFIMSKCKHLPDLGNSPSNIPTNILDSSICFKSDIKTCTPKYISSITSGLLGKAGCYAFFNTSTQELLYVGSCINYPSRIAMHYDHYLDDKVNTMFYTGIKKLGGFSNLSFISVLTISNLVQLYISTHERPSLYALGVLRVLTQFEIRMNEQALLSYYNPSMNSNQSVIFGFNKSRLFAATVVGSVPVKAIDELRNTYSFISIKQTKAFLGLNESVITRSANCVPNPSWCYSSELDIKVHFIIESYPTKTVRANSTDFTPLEYDFSSLPMNYVCFLDKDKVLLPGTYKGFKHALEAIGIPKSKPGKYANKDFLLYSSVLGQSVYMVYNPVTNLANGFRQRKLKAVDTLGLEPDKFFLSGKELMENYKMTRPFNSYIKRGNKVNKRYLIYYVDE